MKLHMIPAAAQSSGPRRLRAGALVWMLGAGVAGTAFAADVCSRAGQLASDNPSTTLAGLSSAAGALLCGWLLTVALTCGFARSPGPVGAIADRTARRIAPLALRRLLNVLLGSAILAPGLAAHGGEQTPSVAPASVAHGTTPHAHDDALPDPGFGPPAAPVVVRPGDTLWNLAEDRLPAPAQASDIAQAWPRWFAANRAELDDPDLILPGQRLVPPATDAGSDPGATTSPGAPVHP
ncbi:MAG: LysM peptidoglycan-binding domain-containing protein [Dermatophilaceae bacterium]